MRNNDGWRGLFQAKQSSRILQMADDLSNQHYTPRSGGVPLAIAIAIAVLGVLGMLIVDHGPWNKPQVRTAQMAVYTTTGNAARAAGATVSPTEPKQQLEPDAPGPKPVHPANPVTP
jgi:hypothetical protein